MVESVRKKQKRKGNKEIEVIETETLLLNQFLTIKTNFP